MACPLLFINGLIESELYESSASSKGLIYSCFSEVFGKLILKK